MYNKTSKDQFQDCSALWIRWMGLSWTTKKCRWQHLANLPATESNSEDRACLNLTHTEYDNSWTQHIVTTTGVLQLTTHTPASWQYLRTPHSAAYIHRGMHIPYHMGTSNNGGNLKTKQSKNWADLKLSNWSDIQKTQNCTRALT